MTLELSEREAETLAVLLEAAADVLPEHQDVRALLARLLSVNRLLGTISTPGCH